MPTQKRYTTEGITYTTLPLDCLQCLNLLDCERLHHPDTCKDYTYNPKWRDI